MHRLLSGLFFALTLPAVMGVSGKSELEKSEQCLVVLTENWDSANGVLQAFERNDVTAAWKDHGPEVPVVVGKKGLGQGVGLVVVEFKDAPRKKEGDNKAPAGIFRLSSAFGYAPRRSARWIRLPYLSLSKTIEGIDDPKSRYYTQLVDRSKIAHPDWRSSEQMLRDDALYKWGVVVEHNARAIRGAGSCIFLHIWISSRTPTSGCTAMSSRDMLRVISWLDRAKEPRLIQLPHSEWKAGRINAGLP